MLGDDAGYIFARRDIESRVANPGPGRGYRPSKEGQAGHLTRISLFNGNIISRELYGDTEELDDFVSYAKET